VTPKLQGDSLRSQDYVYTGNKVAKSFSMKKC
ncbi:MAG: hypothetical protein RLZZ443_539, partial [Actinomycetota bacterium]